MMTAGIFFAVFFMKNLFLKVSDCRVAGNVIVLPRVVIVIDEGAPRTMSSAFLGL